jgi:hypothetical protein
MLNILLESFRGGRGGGGSGKNASGGDTSNTSGNTGGILGGGVAGATPGVIASGVGAASMSNSGSNNIEKCPINDDSFYCQISRTASITGMVIYIFTAIMLFLALLYYMYILLFKKSNKSFF